MGRKTIISGTSLLFSLTAYYIAKKKGVDRMPVMMVAGFIGAVVGEGIVDATADAEAAEIREENADDTIE